MQDYAKKLLDNAQQGNIDTTRMWEQSLTQSREEVSKAETRLKELTVEKMDLALLRAKAGYELYVEPKNEETPDGG